jgi:site-specific recombinase XerD
MNVSYFLTRPKSKDNTSIYARLCYAGYKTKYYIPESINPKFWNKENQRAKETQKFREYPEFNARLNSIANDINNVYRRYLNDNNNEIPSPELLRRLLDKEVKKKVPVKNEQKSFIELFKEIIDQCKKGVRLNARTGKPIGRNTYKTYETVYNHLSNFAASRKKPVTFNTIDLEFYKDYTEYLIKKIKLSSNTIGKHIEVIKYILNEATEMGLNTNLAFKSKKFKSIKEKVDSIYLTTNEIQAIASLDLSENKRLESVRDLFIIGCYTGLRYSDFSILSPDHIKNGFIETTQTKTTDPVVIPVHEEVKAIIDKYNRQLPRAISNQKMNDYLKEIGRLKLKGKQEPVLNTKVSKSVTKGGVKVVKTYHKYDLISSHTARRSFATNEYLAGTPTITIMAITGHKTEKAFLSYIKLTPSEHAKLLKQHWQKRNNLKAV